MESVLRSRSCRYLFISTTMPSRMNGMRPPTIIWMVMKENSSRVVSSSEMMCQASDFS